MALGVLGALAYLGSGFGLENFFGGTALQEVRVGQCFNGARAAGPTSSVIYSVEIVECSEPHTSELMASFDYPGAGPTVAFPGPSSVQTYSSQECLDSFVDYVGLDFNASALDMTYVYPLQDNWEEGDYSIQCIVHPPAGQETTNQSYRGARR